MVMGRKNEKGVKSVIIKATITGGDKDALDAIEAACEDVVIGAHLGDEGALFILRLPKDENEEEEFIKGVIRKMLEVDNVESAEEEDKGTHYSYG